MWSGRLGLPQHDGVFMQALSFGLLLSGALIDFDSTILFQLAIFFALFFVLHRFLFKPLGVVLDEREEAIDGAKRSAREMESSAEEKIKRFESEMKKVKLEANAERERIHQEALTLERELVAKGRADADGVLHAAEAELRGHAEEARGELQQAVPALASGIVEKLLGRRVH